MRKAARRELLAARLTVSDQGQGSAREAARDRRDRGALMRGNAWRAGFRLDFGGHHALGAGPKPDQHELAGAQLGHPEAAQCLHVYEYVRRALATGEEAESAQAVEPFDLRPLKAAGRGNGDMGSRPQSRDPRTLPCSDRAGCRLRTPPDQACWIPSRLASPRASWTQIRPTP